MDASAELRYYEIQFIKLINSFHATYKLDKLLTFVEMITFISGADLTQIQTAMQQVLTNDTSIRIYREEYLVTLKLFSGLNNTEIRKLAECSPNTILKAMHRYKTGQIFIHPKFGTVQAGEIRKIMKGLFSIASIQ